MRRNDRRGHVRTACTRAQREPAVGTRCAGYRFEITAGDTGVCACETAGVLGSDASGKDTQTPVNEFSTPGR